MKPSVMKVKNEVCIIEVPENMREAMTEARVYMMLTPDKARDLAQDILTMVVEIGADLRNPKE